ncbi:hypothetical protein G4D82_05680 [Flavobacterium sp. CYK-4]|uniref:hypothetical protein n=1 Tax=Flavobacterium lotistagni TaxID=2709660 RepID=UPI0014097ABE|nr:hypothetical protein [Flavobacterium lotistagni]NHM06703.1 hypothetical protein [Flavobacterium lotistagni]
MENQTKPSLYQKAINETKKPGFLKALTVFFCCVIVSALIGYFTDSMSLSAPIGLGLGLVWMGVAYLNQVE